MSKSQRSRDEESVVWFARLRRGLMTVEERAVYEAWRRDPGNAASMSELEGVWQSLDVARGHFGPETLLPRRAAFARPALIAAMCIISLGVGIMSYSGENGFWTKLDWVER